MNTPAYFEIQVESIARAGKFCQELFGWKFTKAEGLPIEYWRIDMPGVCWQGYFVDTEGNAFGTFKASPGVNQLNSTQRGRFALAWYLVSSKYLLPLRYV